MKQIESADMIFDEFLNYQIEIIAQNSKQYKGGPTLRISRKGSTKNVIFYGFANMEKLENYLSHWKSQEQADADRKAKLAAAKKEARAGAVNPFKVGDILYDSWGYEQTNINFYQVVEVKAKSAVIREINAKRSSDDMYGDRGTCVPDPDNFCGEPKLKPVVVRVRHDGSIHQYLSARHGGSLSPYDKGEKGLYWSSYA